MTPLLLIISLFLIAAGVMSMLVHRASRAVARRSGSEPPTSRLAEQWRLLVGAGVIVLIFADPIVRYLIAPGLSPELQAVSAKMMRILLLSPILLGMGIAAKGILETHNRFTMPALAPLVYNIGIIFGAVALAPRYGVTGLAIGVAAAFALSRFVGSFLYGVEPTDPISVAAAVVIMAMVATAAGFFPAHRAVRLDPLSALRYE